jgi:hypothetical protein
MMFFCFCSSPMISHRSCWVVNPGALDTETLGEKEQNGQQHCMKSSPWRIVSKFERTDCLGLDDSKSNISNAEMLKDLEHSFHQIISDVVSEETFARSDMKIGRSMKLLWKCIRITLKCCGMCVRLIQKFELSVLEWIASCNCHKTISRRFLAFVVSSTKLGRWLKSPKAPSRKH